MIVYKVVNLIDGKIYVGQDSKDDPNYFGSGIRIKKAIAKYGKDKFVKIKLCECSTKEELDEKEIYWIKLLNATDKLVGYNISIGGNRYRDCGGTTNEKIRRTLTGRKQPAELIEKRINKIRGKKKPQSFCDAMSRVHSGKIVTQETRDKIRVSHIGKKVSVEVRKKMSDSKTGEKNHFYGKSHTDETKEKMRLAKLGKPRGTKIMLNKEK